MSSPSSSTASRRVRRGLDRLHARAGAAPKKTRWPNWRTSTALGPDRSPARVAGGRRKVRYIDSSSVLKCSLCAIIASGTPSTPCSVLGRSPRISLPRIHSLARSLAPLPRSGAHHRTTEDALTDALAEHTYEHGIGSRPVSRESRRSTEEDALAELAHEHGIDPRPVSRESRRSTEGTGP